MPNAGSVSLCNITSPYFAEWFFYIHQISLLQLLAEQDLLLGENTCVNFRLNWTKIAPLIMEVAKMDKRKNVVHVLTKHLHTNLDDFGIQN